MTKPYDDCSDDFRDMILSFETPEHRFLSNFYPSTIEYNGHRYLTVEHAYQASKVVKESDRQKIQDASSPGQAKRLGRRIKMHRNWDAVKNSVMLDLVELKFRDKDLAGMLIATGTAELIEGNTWGDTYWGMCFDPVLETWVGENHLGQILMEVRAKLAEEF